MLITQRVQDMLIGVGTTWHNMVFAQNADHTESTRYADWRGYNLCIQYGTTWYWYQENARYADWSLAICRMWCGFNMAQHGTTRCGYNIVQHALRKRWWTHYDTK